MSRSLSLMLMFGAIVLNVGCVSSVVARKLVEAPNRQALPAQLRQMDEFFQSFEKESPGFWSKALNNPPMTQSWRVPREGRTEIAVTSIEPADHKVTSDLRIARGRTASVSFNFTIKADEKIRSPKGTLVLLHGVAMRKETLVGWAFHLAAAGYRTVLVDLRGHGQSTGDYITFGQREAGDLSAVLDSLEGRQLLAGRVGVMGVSYGASVGLLWAAREPRIAAAVAIEPYSDAKSAIAGFFREFAGGPISLLSPASFNTAMKKAAAEAGFSWDEVGVVDAVEKLTFPVLFFHGAHDNLLPVWHSATLRSRAKTGSRLVIRGNDDHLTLSVRLQPIAGEVVAWFDSQLGADKSAPILADAEL